MSFRFVLRRYDTVDFASVDRSSAGLRHRNEADGYDEADEYDEADGGSPNVGSVDWSRGPPLSGYERIRREERAGSI